MAGKVTARVLLFTAILSLFIHSLSAPARGDVLRAKGYVKPLFVLTDFGSTDDAAGTDSGMNAVETSFITTLRASIFWKPGGIVTGEFAYELIPRVQDPVSLQTSLSRRAADPFSYRALDIGETAYTPDDNSDVHILQNIDRAVIILSPRFADIAIGRQPVSFGSARVINPTDVLSAFTSVELNKEERIGVDALRVRIPAGQLSEIDAGAVFGNNFSAKESALFLRGRFSVDTTDVAPIVMIYKENLLIGMDMARSLGDAGFWFEGAYTFANAIDSHLPQQDYLRFSTGLDYSFTGDLYAYIEYHFNGPGAKSRSQYNDLILGREHDIAYRAGGVYLLSRHYLAPGASYRISPLLSLFTQVIYNINDRSLLLSPVFQYSLSDDILIEAGAFIGAGGKGDRGGAMIIPDDAEFRRYPDTCFVSTKWYF